MAKQKTEDKIFNILAKLKDVIVIVRVITVAAVLFWGLLQQANL